jgi:hypothetical protein
MPLLEQKSAEFFPGRGATNAKEALNSVVLDSTKALDRALDRKALNNRNLGFTESGSTESRSTESGSIESGSIESGTKALLDGKSGLDENLDEHKVCWIEVKRYPYQPDHQVELLHLQAEADALLIKLQARGQKQLSEKAAL